MSVLPLSAASRRPALGLSGTHRRTYSARRLFRKPPGPSAVVKTLLGMAQNFIECDREQLLLMSPSLREWLPDNHLAWFVIDAVGDVDLSAF